MVSNSTGHPLIFNNPEQIELEDTTEGIAFTSTEEPFYLAGQHNLQTNSSVVISFNNLNSYNKSITASYALTATNSTSGEMTGSWDLFWNITEEIAYTGTISDRSLFISVPGDWDSNGLFTYNNSYQVQLLQQDNMFIFSLNDSKEGGDFCLCVQSPNYIEEININDFETQEPIDDIYLGRWQSNETHLIGEEGTTMEIDVRMIRSDINDQLNISLFNSSTSIVPMKTDLPESIVYNDNSSYSILEEYDGQTGFSGSITFDPSINGSDHSGYWTLFLFWCNHSEFGFFTRTLAVKKATSLDYSFEELPHSDIWVEDLSTPLTRKYGDFIDFIVNIYDISESYTNISDNHLSSTLFFNTSWGKQNSMSINDLDEVHTIIIDSPAGNQFIELEIGSEFMQMHNLTSLLEVYFVYESTITDAHIRVDEGENASIMFQMLNISHSENISIIPDTIDMTINNNPVSETFYSFSKQDDLVVVTIDLQSYGLAKGNHSIGLSISKEHFIEDYSSSSSQFMYTLELIGGETPTTEPDPTETDPTITDPTTSNGIDPLVLIGIVSVLLLILGTTISYYTIKKRQSSQPTSYNDLFLSVASIKNLLVVQTETSLPIYELDFDTEIQVDAALISGYFSAISSFGKQLTGDLGGLVKKIEYEDLMVTSIKGPYTFLFIVSELDINKRLLEELIKFMSWFNETFDDTLENWDGSTNAFRSNISKINTKLIDQSFLWLLYPLTIDQTYEKSFDELGKVAKTVIELLKIEEELTVRQLIRRHHDDPEKIIKSLIELKEKGIIKYIQTNQLDTEMGEEEEGQ